MDPILFKHAPVSMSSNKHHGYILNLISQNNSDENIIGNISELVSNSYGRILDIQHHYDIESTAKCIRLDIEIDIDIDKIDYFKNVLINFKKSHNYEFELIHKIKHTKIGILVSKYNHCLYDLLLRKQYNEIDADIEFIVSNHEDLRYIADNFSIPFFYISISSESKRNAEKELLEICENFGVDLLVLARYMQILTPKVLNKYKNKIINVHHGLLPAFKGAKPYHQAFEKGVKIIGATSHYANEELDMGPIISQEISHVNHANNVESLMAKGRDLEKKTLSDAVIAHIQNRIMVIKNRTIIFN
jgi:formyltetrahydrofolate deformylase